MNDITITMTSSTISDATTKVDKSERWQQVAHQLWSIKEQLKMLEEQEAVLAAELRQLSDNKTTSYGSFAYIATGRKGNVDYSLIPVLQGLDLEPYRKKETVVWKLEKIK